MKFNLVTAKTVVDLVKQLKLGLRKLTLDDNLEGFTVQDLEIEANDDVTIQNKLTFVPKQYIITSQVGNGLVTKTGNWNEKYLFLINNGPDTVKVTVFFTR